MVKDHSDSEMGNQLPPHGLLFPISSNGSFICIISTTVFVTPLVEHWLEREIAQWVHPTKDRPDDPSHHERTLLPRNYIWLPPSDEFKTHIRIPNYMNGLHTPPTKDLFFLSTKLSCKNHKQFLLV